MENCPAAPCSRWAEPFRKKIGNRCLLPTLGTLEKNDSFRPELVNNLAASPARRTRYAFIIHHGNGLNVDLRSQLRNRRKDGRAFRAVSHSIRSIFYITTNEYLAIFREQRGSHAEIGIRSIGMFHCRAGRLQQSLPSSLSTGGFF